MWWSTVADGRHIRWTKAATLLLNGTQACVDGRDAHAVVGTPGGDVGELLRTLAATERLVGSEISPDDIERVFDRSLKAFGRFYLHSDHHALRAGLERVGVERSAGDLDVIKSPPQSMRAALLDVLAQPEFVACGHLRLMLQHPNEYGVRTELVATVIRVFFQRLWAGHPDIDFVVLTDGPRPIPLEPPCRLTQGSKMRVRSP